MTNQPRIIWLNTSFLILSPLGAAILVPWQLAQTGFRWSELAGLVALWALTLTGISAGYHRLWSHRAWKAPRSIEIILAVLGGATWQNSAIAWSADHRRHHRYTDQKQDPYNALRGFWWSHVGWAMLTNGYEDDLSNVPDLQADPVCRWQDRHYLLISTSFNVLVPILFGLMTGRVWEMLLWAGLFRAVVVHHTTFFINSLAHIWGTRPWSEANTSRDNALLAFLTFGEGYHNYHHAFQSDYRNGVRWYHFDPSKWLIWGLARVGFASDLRRSPVDALLRKRSELLKERYREAMNEWQGAARRRVAEADTRLEAALSNFCAAREEWSRQAEHLERRAKRELRVARAQAKAELLSAFRDWQQALEGAQSAVAA